MPLLGTLHRGLPDDDQRHSLGVAWVCALLGRLNRELLPRDEFRADADVQSEVKVLEELLPRPGPMATTTTAAVLPDRCQVLVRSRGSSFQPAGVVALVTPRIKADARKRAMFVARCLGILSNATGLVVIDAIPGTHPTPCAELAAALGLTLSIPPLAVLSFRTVLRGESPDLGVWVRPLSVGEPIPPMPFALHGGPTIELPLEATYTAAACDHGLLPPG